MRRVLTDYHTFSSEMLVDRFPEEKTLNSDPPRHQRYRRIVQSYFTPRAIQFLRARLTALVDELLTQGIGDGGTIDMVQALAYPLPVRVIAQMLGLPREDEERLRNWSYQLAGLTGEADDEFRQYITGQIGQHAREPREDLMSTLLAAESAGELTRGEVIFLVMGLVAAGNVTTTMLLSLAIRRFVEQPEIYQELLRRPSLIPSTMEELFRFEFARTSMMRLVQADTTLSGQPLKAGEPILAWVSAANFDESVFPQALQFQHERYPNRHLSFGYGTRSCLGAHLARLEGQVFLERMVARFTSIQGHPEWKPIYADPRFDLILSYPVIVTPS